VVHRPRRARFEIELGPTLSRATMPEGLKGGRRRGRSGRGRLAASPALAVAEYTLVKESPPPTAAAAAAADKEGETAEDAAAQQPATVLDLHHTEVPPALRGRGIAGRLCEAVFRYAQESGMRVRPTCTYVSHHWLPRNQHWRHLVVVTPWRGDAEGGRGMSVDTLQP
jgi:predicted GNAT family acetyltransferase